MIETSVTRLLLLSLFDPKEVCNTDSLGLCHTAGLRIIPTLDMSKLQQPKTEDHHHVRQPAATARLPGQRESGGKIFEGMRRIFSRSGSSTVSNRPQTEHHTGACSYEQVVC